MYNLSSTLPPNSDPDLELAAAILEIIPRAMREIRDSNRSSKGQDLKLPEYRVLAHVWRRPKTNKELADDIGLSVPAMSRLISGLGQKGLIQRLENPADRREYYIQITRQGLILFRNIRKETSQRIYERIKVLNEHEKSALSEGLLLILKTLAEPLSN